MRSLRLRAVFSTTLIALCALAGCSDDGDGGSGLLDGLTGDATAGAALYADLPGNAIDCVSCHGTGGRGDGELAMAMGPDGALLYDPSPSDLTVTPLTDEEIAVIIHEGKGQMPAVPALTNQQLADLVAYVNQLRGR